MEELSQQKPIEIRIEKKGTQPVPSHKVTSRKYSPKASLNMSKRQSLIVKPDFGQIDSESEEKNMFSTWQQTNITSPSFQFTQTPNFLPQMERLQS